MISLVENIKKNKRLKKIVLLMLMPNGQARPRLWVRIALNRFYHKRGKHVTIRRKARLDVFPFNQFIVGRSATIEDFSVINNGLGEVSIGDNSRIGIGSTIIGPVSIGNNVILAQHVVISGFNHGYADISIPITLQDCLVKGVIIEDDCWIGANSVILPGVCIGKHSVIAAGSIVTKSVPSYTVAGGNPACIIKRYNIHNGQWEKVKEESNK